MTTHNPINTTNAIEVEMTWAGAAKLIELGLEAGTFEGKRIAREELARMADAADRAIEAQKATPKPTLNDQNLADLHDLARVEWYRSDRSARRLELVRLGHAIESVQAARAA